MDQIDHVLTRGVAEILPNKDGLKKLMQQKKIRLYQGFDPSAPSLHLGNYVGLMKLRQFQKLGHEVIFLVGDFTGMIGDPTDKTATRKKLTREEVRDNSSAWIAQAGKLLDFSGKNPAKILYNSSWSDPITFKDLIEITSNFTVQQMIERDMFQDRIKNQKPIYLHEFLYPVAQGYDSVCMDVDLEIGGKDQLFNMLAGRTLMKTIKNKEKFVLGTKLLVDKDGNKVGKTTGNALFLDSKPEDFYAGVMSFPDEVIYLGFELLTEVNLDGMEIQISQDPMKEKKHLAREIVKLLWGEAASQIAETNFVQLFQKHGQSDDVLKISITEGITIVDLISQTGKSKTEAKRLVRDHAVEVDQKIVENPDQEIKKGQFVRVGKKIFLQTQ
jgi:tyrosyl-tRNA synthetase